MLIYAWLLLDCVIDAIDKKIIGFIIGGVARGILVGIIVSFLSMFFAELYLYHAGITLSIVILTSVLFSLGGFINAIYAN